MRAPRRNLVVAAAALGASSVLIGCSSGTSIRETAEVVELPPQVAERIAFDYDQPYLVGETDSVMYAAVLVDDDPDVDLCLAQWLKEPAGDDWWNISCAREWVGGGSTALGDAELYRDGVPDEPERGSAISPWVVVRS